MTGRERTDQEVKQIVIRAKRLPEFARKEIACVLIASTLASQSRSNCVKNIKP
jgi:hypothetical protein